MAALSAIDAVFRIVKVPYFNFYRLVSGLQAFGEGAGIEGMVLRNTYCVLRISLGVDGVP